MRVSDRIACSGFPCRDVNHSVYQVPGIEVDPEKVSMVMISEAAPANPADYYYSGEMPFFAQTTLDVFRDAGLAVHSIAELLQMGVYLTTAVKCGKTAYNIENATVQTCSRILEQELALFPNVKAYMLMGDVAIKAVNAVAKNTGEPRVIPAGSTYKIRNGVYSFRGARAFPSYLQVGPSFNIEKSKRKMVAEDIAAALACL